MRLFPMESQASSTKTSLIPRPLLKAIHTGVGLGLGLRLAKTVVQGLAESLLHTQSVKHQVLHVYPCTSLCIVVLALYPLAKVLSIVLAK